MYSFLKQPDLETGIGVDEINQYQEFLILRSRRDGNDKGSQLSTWLEFQKEY